MPNTRGALKRTKQAEKRRDRNRVVRSSTRTAIKNAVEAIDSKDAEKAKPAYEFAVKSLAKAASKGAFPRTRVARKISRLTMLAKKAFPEALNFKN